MGRRSKSVESFLRSLDEYHEKRRQEVRARVFADELFVFGDFGVGRMRRTATDYIILGDRRRGPSFSGMAISRALPFDSTERTELYRALDGDGEFAVVSCGGRAAVIYRGLLRSYRIGIMSLTDHAISAASAARGEDFGHLFGDVTFHGVSADVSYSGNPGRFISDYMSFRHDVLSACGVEGDDGIAGFDDMISATADMVGCEVLHEESRKTFSERVDRDTSAAVLVCLLSAIRSVSSDRCAHINVGESDGDAVIHISFKPYGEFNGERSAFIDFCRSFSELHGIPFSFGTHGDLFRVSFIPVRIDPSIGGLKASVNFNLDRNGSR